MKQAGETQNLVQAYLQAGGTLEELAAKYALKSVRHAAYPNLVLVKYNQIDSPFAEPLVRHARGVIMDESDNWSIVSRPFDKFFNYGEGHAAPIDWDTARIYEKLDGSLCHLYHYDGQWHIATSGTPDAGGEVNGFGFTFRELFWRVWGEHGYMLPHNDLRDWTPMFELMTPYNRVVVPHKENRLIFIGLRNRVTGREVAPEEAVALGFPEYKVVRRFDFARFDEAMMYLQQQDGLYNEGYVTADAAFNRVKAKNTQYVAIHHMRDGFGPKRVLEVVRSGESSEFVTYYPEFAPMFNAIREQFEKMVAELEETYEKIKHFEVQKDFALEAVKYKCSGALFMKRRNEQQGKPYTVRQHLAEMSLNSLMEYLGVKDIVQSID